MRTNASENTYTFPNISFEFPSLIFSQNGDDTYQDELNTCFRKVGDFTIDNRFVISNDLYNTGTAVIMKIDKIFTTYLLGRQRCRNQTRNLVLADDFIVVQRFPRRLYDFATLCDQQVIRCYRLFR